MLRTFTILLALCFLNIGFGQDCVFGGDNPIILNTQEEVDNFPFNHPNCIDIQADIIIENTNINNLNGLSIIDHYNGDIYIINNDQLLNLDGFSFLGEDNNVGLYIEDNELLNDISGMANVSFYQTIRIINNNSLTNIDGLTVDFVFNGLIIRDNPVLTNIDGLSNLVDMPVFHSDLIIENNASLENLDGLSSLEIVSGQIRIASNPSLTNINGLGNCRDGQGNGTQAWPSTGITISNNDLLTNIDSLHQFDGVETSIRIFGNELLEDIDGLSRIEIIGRSIYIHDNPNLQNLDGLQNASIGSFFNIPPFVYPYLHIYNNPSLTSCVNEGICNILPKEGLQTLIYNNGGGCMSLEEVGGSCPDRISGVVFYDYNENKIKDDFEGGINNYPITLNDYNLYTDHAGFYLFGLPEGTPYSISLPNNPNYTLTTDFTSYNATYELGQASNHGNYFGFIAENPSHEFTTSFIDLNPRCGEISDFYINFYNSGTFIENNVSLQLTYSDNLAFSDVFPTPDFHDEDNNILTWNFEEMYPWVGTAINVEFVIPDFNFIGDPIDLTVTSFYDNNGSQEAYETLEYNGVVSCSFDPNDKQVQPVGEGEEHFTPKDEPLNYTVRFQNTGNAVAYDVTIRDTLDSDLDWSTFKLLHASHSQQTTLTEDGALEFFFENIYLPDSTSNYEGSQGFVRYSIEPIADLPDNTVIENTAHIYFDNNPAVVTNTVFNTLIDPPTVAVKERFDAPFFMLFPNPTSGDFKINIENIDHFQNYNLEIIDISGQSLLRKEASKLLDFQLNYLSSGMYFVLLKNRKSGEVVYREKLVLSR